MASVISSSEGLFWQSPDEEITDAMEALAESREPPADSRSRPPGVTGEARATVESRGTHTDSSGI
eukprot:2625464-Lingulodinium_polyedra.AAC.1